MVLNNVNEEWVAFGKEDSSIFEAEFPASPPVAVKKSDRYGKSARKSGKSARKSSKSKDDTNSVATWMNKPINSDASWAPMAPPALHMGDDEEHPVRYLKNRPPAKVKESTSSDDSNPVSSSSSDSSTSERQSRNTSRTKSSKRSTSKPRPVAVAVPVLKAPPQKKIPLSPRGRSQAVPRGRQQPVTVQRSRSVSRTRSSAQEGSSSAKIPSTIGAVDTKGRSRDRPPVTSPRIEVTRRSRSTSRARIPRARSTSRTRKATTPTGTMRSRLEARSVGHGYGSIGGPHSEHRRATGGSTDERSFHSADPNIGRNISFGRTQSSTGNKSTEESIKKRSQIMEKLFGDQVQNDKGLSCISTQQPMIHSRILLTATVYHNTATNLWIATINTNQKGVAKNPTKASRYLKAFSFSTEKEARESAIANAPPKMMKFDENPTCHTCKGKFAVFRRASHCRNCGVCICSSCSVSWTAKSIPETYNLKKESHVRVCKSCNLLSSAFKKALLEGDYEEAIAIYGSGNINLRTPFPQFSNKKEEVKYPIHCAVEGGNLSIVRWLMEDHFCPVKVIRTAGGAKKSKEGSQDYPILTSKGRSVLTIAMDNIHVNVLRYLVIDCGFSIYESKDLKGSLRALEAVLNALPSGMGEYRSDGFCQRWDDAVYDETMSVASSLGADFSFHGSMADERSMRSMRSSRTRVQRG